VSRRQFTRKHTAEERTPEQLREHYEIEGELADRLRAAPRERRLELYGSVYDELFRRVPLHPQLTKKQDPATFRWSIERQVAILRPFLRPEATFLEIGAGDCALSAAIAPRVRQVYAVDVSAEIMQGLALPANVETRVSDGITIPVPDAGVDVAFSNQVMEHLHPDDALEQLGRIHSALGPAGVYVCVTPNRLTGPHDISMYFDERATGFHLREYSFGELRRIFLEVGFSRVRALVGGRGRYAGAPPAVVEALESALTRFSAPTRRVLARRLLVSGILGIRVVGIK
jgi:SAM-dependent methyltransferase